MGSSKKYKGKLCVYCRRNRSTTADHVFPREIFQLEQRSMLPKVPSCLKCNNEKSKLEHYLLSVLPFGATHSNAHKALSIDVVRRLSKNRKLHEKIKKESGYCFIPSSNNDLETRLTIRLDFQMLHDFIGFIGRGLMWHHWEKSLPLNYSLKVFTPSPTGMSFLDGLFQLSTSYRVDVNLGNGTVRYKGVMSETDEGLSVWAIQLLGGITVSDDKLNHVFSNSLVAMITGSPEMLKKIQVYEGVHPAQSL